MSFPHTGSCLCGTVQFEIKEFLEESAHCHCSMCRKFHGAAYASYGSVKNEHFCWTLGQNELSEYTATNGTRRLFCKHCGSSLAFFSANGSPDVIEIALAAMDGQLPAEALPNAHIYTHYALSWTSMDDTLPCYGEGRPVI
jgi:hypothetical protein